jgi:hypothetical protein
MRRSLSTLAAVAGVVPVLLVAGCGNDSTSSAASRDASGSPTTSSAPATPMSPSDTASSPASASAERGTVIDVKVRGDKVTPNGERVEAEVGEPVTLRINANRAGEMHVHSTPEQELEYGSGRTVLRVTIDKPGVVDVEDHIAEVVVVQLEVS